MRQIYQVEIQIYWLQMMHAAGCPIPYHAISFSILLSILNSRKQQHDLLIGWWMNTLPLMTLFNQFKLLCMRWNLDCHWFCQVSWKKNIWLKLGRKTSAWIWYCMLWIFASQNFFFLLIFSGFVWQLIWWAFQEMIYTIMRFPRAASHNFISVGNDIGLDMRPSYRLDFGKGFYLVDLGLMERLVTLSSGIVVDKKVHTTGLSSKPKIIICRINLFFVQQFVTESWKTGIIVAISSFYLSEHSCTACTFYSVCKNNR